MSDDKRIRNAMMLDYSQLIMHVVSLEKELEEEKKAYIEIYNRNQKAIEYVDIVMLGNEEYKDEWEFKVFMPNLLEILKGEDKEC